MKSTRGQRAVRQPISFSASVQMICCDVVQMTWKQKIKGKIRNFTSNCRRNWPHTRTQNSEVMNRIFIKKKQCWLLGATGIFPGTTFPGSCARTNGCVSNERLLGDIDFFKPICRRQKRECKAQTSVCEIFTSVCVPERRHGCFCKVKQQQQSGSYYPP